MVVGKPGHLSAVAIFSQPTKTKVYQLKIFVIRVRENFLSFFTFLSLYLYLFLYLYLYIGFTTGFTTGFISGFMTGFMSGFKCAVSKERGKHLI